jgi:hypothetical protein
LRKPEAVLIDGAGDFPLADGAIEGRAVGEPAELHGDAIFGRHLVGDELHERLLGGISLRRDDRERRAFHEIR